MTQGTSWKRREESPAAHDHAGRRIAWNCPIPYARSTIRCLQRSSATDTPTSAAERTNGNPRRPGHKNPSARTCGRQLPAGTYGSSCRPRPGARSAATRDRKESDDENGPGAPPHAAAATARIEISTRSSRRNPTHQRRLLRAARTGGSLQRRRVLFFSIRSRVAAARAQDAMPT